MNRRLFIQQSSVLGAGVAIAPDVLAYPKKPKSLQQLTILHTNDTHSNIDAFPENHSKYPNQGGVRRRMTLVNQIREEVENVLLLDAGDIFQGTPYFNKFEGRLDMKVMSEMNYDCGTLGNHDFDIGLEGFLKAKKFADFPFVNVNYDFKNTPLAGQIEPYKIFNKGPFKVGIFGVGVQLKGLVPEVLYADTEWSDSIKPANDTATFLRMEEECDLVICLSHLGYEAKQFKMSDKILAKETSNIDLIIGGHTHTFLDKPEVHQNKSGEKVIINQVGWGGLALGRIDFFLGDRKRHKGYELVMV